MPYRCQHSQGGAIKEKIREALALLKIKISDLSFISKE
jgi:hypothetical protein